jgi:hypothetical protein
MAGYFPLGKDNIQDLFGEPMTHRLVYLEDKSGPTVVRNHELNEKFTDRNGASYYYKKLVIMQFLLEHKPYVAAVVGELPHPDPATGMTHKLFYLGKNCGPPLVNLDQENTTLNAPGGYKGVPYTCKVPLTTWSYEQDGKQLLVKGPETRMGPDFDGKRSSVEKVHLQAEVNQLEKSCEEAEVSLMEASYQRKRLDLRRNEVNRAILEEQLSQSSDSDARSRSDFGSLKFEFVSLLQALRKDGQALRKRGVVSESSLLVAAISEMEKKKQKLEAEVREKELLLDDIFSKILKHAPLLNLDFSNQPIRAGDMEMRVAVIEDALVPALELDPKDIDLRELSVNLRAFRQLYGEIDVLRQTLEINRVRLAIAKVVPHLDRATKALHVTQVAAISLEANERGSQQTIAVEMREGVTEGQEVVIDGGTDKQESNIVAGIGSDRITFKDVLKYGHPIGALIQAEVWPTRRQLIDFKRSFAGLFVQRDPSKASSESRTGTEGSKDEADHLRRMDAELRELRVFCKETTEILAQAEQHSFTKTNFDSQADADDEENVYHSPRKPAPELKFSIQTLEIAGRPLALVAAKAQEIEPWEAGGSGTLTQRKYNHSYALHFDMNLKAKSVRISPDQTSASWLWSGFGGFLFSVEPLKKKTYGRYFEVVLEDVDYKYGSDGIGIGVAVRPHPSEIRPEARDQNGKYEGFAGEVLSDVWLVGYNGSVQLKGRSRYLRGLELPNGVWPPGRGQFSETAGCYKPSDKVEYYSQQDKGWVITEIRNVDGKGRVMLNSHASSSEPWISVEEQACSLRPMRVVHLDYAGTYRVDMCVDTFTREGWVATTVTNVDDRGSILLGSDTTSWIPTDEQAHVVRPSRGFCRGGKIGLLNTSEGHLFYFWNDKVKYAVLDACVPWNKELNAVIDLDGCVQTIHLTDTNGTMPLKAISSFMATARPGAFRIPDETSVPSTRMLLSGYQAPAPEIYVVPDEKKRTLKKAVDSCPQLEGWRDDRVNERFARFVANLPPFPSRGKHSQSATQIGQHLQSPSKASTPSSPSKPSKSSSFSQFRATGSQIITGSPPRPAG